MIGPLSVPLFLLLVGLVAAGVAGQLNRGIYRLAWNKRSISPWSSPPAGVPPRGVWDRLPILGWWRLRREAARHGRAFWMRPLLIEVAFVTGIVALGWFELQAGLLPIGARPAAPETLAVQFLSHACLVALMVVATFIDLDEKTIPDEITVPGTLLAVFLAAIFPGSALPTWTPAPPPIPIEPLRLTTPGAWQPRLDGTWGYGLAVFCIAAWWYALLPKTLWYRSGWRKFLQYLGASLWRRRFSPLLSMLGLLALAGTTIAWWRGGEVWQAVLSAWVGMAVGGALIWAVRLVGSAALGQEAMGFGDVTLMGMIGAFLGWQPAVLIFFLAPFTGVVVAISQWLLTGSKDIAYGPFLCTAALLLIVGWAAAWRRWGYPVFSLGSLLPIVMFCGLILLGATLWAIRRSRGA